MIELMKIMQELQSSDLQINNLNLISMDQKEGIIIKLTSPDPDGVKLAGIFGKLFKELLVMAKQQAPTAKINFKHIPLE